MSDQQPTDDRAEGTDPTSPLDLPTDTGKDTTMSDNEHTDPDTPSTPDTPDTDRTEQLDVGTRELPQATAGDPYAPEPHTEDSYASAYAVPAQPEPVYAVPAPSEPTYAVSAQPEQGYAAPERVWKRGPSVATVVAGLICLVVAGLAYASVVSDVDVNWAVTGPGLVLGFGVVLVLLGLLGMARRARS